MMYCTTECSMMRHPAAEQLQNDMWFQFQCLLIKNIKHFQQYQKYLNCITVIHQEQTITCH